MLTSHGIYRGQFLWRIKVKIWLLTYKIFGFWRTLWFIKNRFVRFMTEDSDIWIETDKFRLIDWKARYYQMERESRKL